MKQMINAINDPIVDIYREIESIKPYSIHNIFSGTISNEINNEIRILTLEKIRQKHYNATGYEISVLTLDTIQEKYNKNK